MSGSSAVCSDRAGGVDNEERILSRSFSMFLAVPMRTSASASAGMCLGYATFYKILPSALNTFGAFVEVKRGAYV